MHSQDENCNILALTKRWESIFSRRRARTSTPLPGAGWEKNVYKKENTIKSQGQTFNSIP